MNPFVVGAAISLGQKLLNSGQQQQQQGGGPTIGVTPAGQPLYPTLSGPPKPGPVPLGGRQPGLDLQSLLYFLQNGGLDQLRKPGGQ